MRSHLVIVVVGLLVGVAWTTSAQQPLMIPPANDKTGSNVESSALMTDIAPVTAAADAMSPSSTTGIAPIIGPLKITSQQPTLVAGMASRMFSSPPKEGKPTFQSEFVTVADGISTGTVSAESLSDYCGCGPACGGSCGSGCRKRCCGRHCSGVFGEILYIQGAGGDDVAFAMPFDGCDPATAVPVGAAGVVGQEFEPAFSVGLIKALSCRSSIRVGYERFEGNSFAQIITIPNNFIRSLVTHPGTAVCASNSLEANADYDIQFDLIDVDYRRTICAGCCGSIDGIFGLRYGRLEQKLEVNQAIGVGITTVTTDIDFEGVGIRVGLEGETRPGGGCFLLYGKAILNLIAGEFKADYLQFNSFAQTQAVTSWEDDRFVPTLDGEIGFGYRTCWKKVNVHLSLGYTVSAWFNAVTTSEYIGAVQTNNYVEIGDALVFDGFVGRAELTF